MLKSKNASIKVGKNWLPFLGFSWRGCFFRKIVLFPYP
jgi:hypothetical protein